MTSFPCPDCGTLVSVDAAKIDGYLCPKCQWTHWRNVGEPDKPYRLSENDRTFLRVQGILPEV